MTYNSDQTIELLQRAVAEKGDGYVYPGADGYDTFSCRYADYLTVAPSCLIGHVLDYLGLLSEAAEGHSANRMEVVHNQFTPGSALVLRAAQILQDKGHAWGEALIAAKETADAKDQRRFLRDLE